MRCSLIFMLIMIWKQFPLQLFEVLIMLKFLQLRTVKNCATMQKLNNCFIMHAREGSATIAASQLRDEPEKSEIFRINLMKCSPASADTSANVHSPKNYLNNKRTEKLMQLFNLRSVFIRLHKIHSLRYIAWR